MQNTDYKINLNELTSILARFRNKKILVIGDLMLDHYLWGQAERISSEAPVPIVDVEKQEFRLGGAANVVNNIISLGAIPLVVGLTGHDNNSEVLAKLFRDKNIKTNFIIKDKTRPTTVKTRIFAAGQQVMRYDNEQRLDVTGHIEDEVLQMFDLAIYEADAILIEDYNKGLLTPRVIQNIIQRANKMKTPIAVDPKFKGFFLYKGCTLFKPNLNELQKNLNIDISSEEDLINAAHELLKQINPEHLVITLGQKGLIAFDKDNDMIHIPTFAKEVFDVSGAGDTVISVLTLCLTIGLDIKTASIIANHAAGAVCGKRGVHPVTIDDILMNVTLTSLSGV